MPKISSTTIVASSYLISDTICTHFSTIKESNLFASTNPSSVHNIYIDLSCTATYVIYLISCKKCKAQYEGQTHPKCTNPMNSHKYAHFLDTLTNVPDHFNFPEHSIQDYSVLPTGNFKQLDNAFKGNYFNACFSYSFS